MAEPGEIKTAIRPIIDYLQSPLAKHHREALRERGRCLWYAYTVEYQSNRM